jgi:multicomponent Na+:H+ antiporter subunit C
MMLVLATSTTAMSGEGVYNYGLVIFLMMTGLYLILSKGNMIKTIIGLNLFQVSVIMFYVSMGRIEGGTAPILLEHDISHDVEHSEDHGSLQTESGVLVATDGTGNGNHSKEASVKSEDSEETLYSNPLPHVLMLTAIVVGVATTALALALVVRIREFYGTIEEDEVDGIEGELQNKERGGTE